ncbi:hypothetical protein [Halohasta litorea]|uniref:DUF8120 domain-containing protein n=1 Tax=Halohasta litorea TaxID=869891 RepID=A0ABD6DD00_9EURY|nr:hypothetical protein [Halohasta litorea]MEA1931964.1 hypothetical protein [Euryarchaeota archaeon]
MSGARSTSLTGRQYRWVDRITKLLGVGLIAAGLEAGGATPTGMALAVVGVLVGLSTVVITNP